MADCPENNQSLTASDPPRGSSSIITSGNINSAIFDINKMTSAATEYIALSGLANQMFGYEARWFRSVPQQRSKDVIFQEYTL